VGWSSWLGARLTDQDAADYSNTHGRPLPHWEPRSAPEEHADEAPPQREAEAGVQLAQ